MAVPFQRHATTGTTTTSGTTTSGSMNLNNGNLNNNNNSSSSSSSSFSSGSGSNTTNIPLVHLGNSPPRCQRCNGYMNCWVNWTDNGSRWECNLCRMSNSTPAWYYTTLDGKCGVV